MGSWCAPCHVEATNSSEFAGSDQAIALGGSRWTRALLELSRPAARASHNVLLLREIGAAAESGRIVPIARFGARRDVVAAVTVEPRVDVVAAAKVAARIGGPLVEIGGDV